MREKKVDPEIEILNRVTDLLMDENTKPNEREILLNIKPRLEKRVNLPNIVFHLKNELTPLAMQSKLSKGMGKFYCDLVAGNFGNTDSIRTGIGVAMNFGGFFSGI